jgi:hypothetical protein
MGGQAYGQGPGSRPTDTTFRRDQIPATGLLPEGQVVGTFTVDGPSDAGEATIEKGGAIEKAVRDLSQKVETEPLPVESREQVRRFQEYILGGAPVTDSK